MPREKTHVTWSIERDKMKCPYCAGEVRLVLAPHLWRNVDDPDNEIKVIDEISGHYCPTCQVLVSLSLNTSV